MDEPQTWPTALPLERSSSPAHRPTGSDARSLRTICWLGPHPLWCHIESQRPSGCCCEVGNLMSKGHLPWRQSDCHSLLPFKYAGCSFRASPADIDADAGWRALCGTRIGSAWMGTQHGEHELGGPCARSRCAAEALSPTQLSFPKCPWGCSKLNPHCPSWPRFQWVPKY